MRGDGRTEQRKQRDSLFGDDMFGERGEGAAHRLTPTDSGGERGKKEERGEEDQPAQGCPQGLQERHHLLLLLGGQQEWWRCHRGPV